MMKTTHLQQWHGSSHERLFTFKSIVCDIPTEPDRLKATGLLLDRLRTRGNLSQMNTFQIIVTRLVELRVSEDIKLNDKDDLLSLTPDALAEIFAGRRARVSTRQLIAISLAIGCTDYEIIDVLHTAGRSALSAKDRWAQLLHTLMVVLYHNLKDTILPYIERQPLALLRSPMLPKRVWRLVTLVFRCFFDLGDAESGKAKAIIK